mmetsp:Transcript_26570/g.30362  ORF Transcript_26570/g.30362 Transcript_26570/m.30362 type:complete len:98 (+) Transcript_26570:355-648(+)
MRRRQTEEDQEASHIVIVIFTDETSILISPAAQPCEMRATKKREHRQSSPSPPKQGSWNRSGRVGFETMFDGGDIFSCSRSVGPIAATTADDLVHNC